MRRILQSLLSFLTILLLTLFYMWWPQHVSSRYTA